MTTPGHPQRVAADVTLADDWLERVCRRSEMGAMILATDWSATPLGPMRSWPISLRVALGASLSSDFPMLVMWGTDLIKLYNDGYREMLGSGKHPRALGAPVRDVWPEIWDLIGPQFERVLATGEPVGAEHFLMVIERDGFPEEAWFTYCYSALHGDTGEVCGILDVSTETTQEVLAQHRLTCAATLTSSLVGAEQVTDVCQRTVAVLDAFPYVVRAVDVHLLVGDELTLIASNRRDDLSVVDDSDVARVVDRHVEQVIGQVGPGWPADQFCAPIGDDDAVVRGAVVLWLNTRRPFDGAYASFCRLVVGAVSGALEAAYRRSTEVGEHRRVSDTLQAAMLKPARDLPTVAARYHPAAGRLAVGGDWYDVIDVGPHSRALVVGDCVGHGLDAATAMSQLRSATRAMLLEGRDPADVLNGLDLFAQTIDGAFAATVACAVFDRAAGTVTYSLAGHPPPLVVTPDGSHWLDAAVGPPLGVQRARRSNAVADLHDDELVLMYSDGLVERRGEPLDEGLERLRALATRWYGSSVQTVADELLRELSGGGGADDTVLVVKHFSKDDVQRADA